MELVLVFVQFFIHVFVTAEIGEIILNCICISCSWYIFLTEVMDRKESPSQMQKQSKRAKKTMKGLQAEQPLEMQGSLELTEQTAKKQVSEDREVEEEAAEFLHRQKRHSRNTSCGSKSHGKRDIPKTLITAVLEELNDDIIGEPTGFDTGKQRRQH
jgi:hypothetical protein